MLSTLMAATRAKSAVVMRFINDDNNELEILSFWNCLTFLRGDGTQIGESMELELLEDLRRTLS